MTLLYLLVLLWYLILSTLIKI